MDDRFLDTLIEQKERARQFYKFSQYFYYALAAIMLPAFILSLIYKFLMDKYIAKRWLYWIITASVCVISFLIIINKTSIFSVNFFHIKLLFHYFNITFWESSEQNIISWIFGIFSGAGFLIAFQHFLDWSDPIKRKVVVKKSGNKELLEGAKYKKKLEKSLDKIAEKNIDGVFLGLDEHENEIILSPKELNQHILLAGTTGSGKTTTIKIFIEYALKKWKPVIMLDGKGDKKFIEIMQELCLKFDRELLIFSTDGDHLGYNPLHQGSPTELKDKLMTLTEWTEPHYELSSQRYLQIVFNVLDLKGIKPDMPTTNRYLIKKNLLELIVAQEGKPIDINKGHELIEAIEDIDEKAISGLASRIATLTESDLGSLLLCTDNVINLKEVIDDKKVVLFSLDSLKYPDYARSLGKLIINDIKNIVSYHARYGNGSVATIYDEFNVFATKQVVDVINKSRSAGFEALLSFQGLSDLDAVDVTLRRQIVQNTNTHIIQRQNDPADAQEFASIIGTKDGEEITWQRNDEGLTGTGMIKVVKEFIYHPDEIKGLKLGEAIVNRKYPNSRAMKVKIRKIV